MGSPLNGEGDRGTPSGEAEYELPRPLPHSPPFDPPPLQSKVGRGAAAASVSHAAASGFQTGEASNPPIRGVRILDTEDVDVRIDQCGSYMGSDRRRSLRVYLSDY